ncbi:FecCD family ABC transporter permease [Streptomyces alkaliterrae]|uniref:Iron ABC transporter permease n=1 Tax=Streptomyces alkaliterrae TaxID=2213162 RepID=A0A5P0YSM8_9ACTN|nr:iron ABC transporter permease [Streptomyces alkaliterrae]MBB1255113.1 iron ABC transporter permease [Streptomyces alkaliterrae]MBB1258760.1 iron ABC transporter permease [Streptomyces alkaliterrae]MQS02900.1 iron chelate uptake ABC transporter family permease subunit [Streptomyces alkaliterrae]
MTATVSRRFVLLGAVLLAAVCAQVLAGRALSPPAVWEVLTGGGDHTDRHVFFQLRVPRLLVALGAGACLGVAGLVLQSALRNPLAGPEVTGVTPGAVLGAVTATGLGLAGWDSPAAVVLAATVGGFAGAGLLWLLAGRQRSDPAGTAVYGVLVSAVLGGLTAMVLLVAPGELGSVVQWLVGSTEGRVWHHWHLMWPWALAWAVLAWLLAGPLTLLRCGDEQASALGLAADRARALALLCAVALTAAAVSAVGALGFVGLLIPHVAIAVFGADLRVTLPGAALLGATVVCVADALAQSLARTLAVLLDAGRLTLPVGAVTSFLGAALLLLAVRRTPDREY